MDSLSEADLYSCFRTTLEMVEDRGYFIPKELKETNQESFKENFSRFRIDNGFVLLLTSCDSEGKLLIYFTRHEKAISSEDVKRFATKMGEEKVFNGILISNKEMSPSADKLVKDINAESNFHVEHFLINNLLINITHHDLVPKHVISSDEEKKAVLKKYKIKESQLPKILTTDPVAKYLGVKRGQLVKIIRNSETAGIHVVYRIAV